MDSYINLNERFIIDKERRELIDSHTGEIYTDKDEVEKILDTLKQEKEYNKDFEKAVRNIWNIETELELFWLKWKSRSWFVKIYRTEMREYLKEVPLSPNAGLLLLNIQPYIEYETNRIAKPSGESFSNKELEELTGLSRNTVYKVLNELEEKKFIVRVGQRQSREIYFNPYLACAGNKVSKDTVKLFDTYKPIT